MEVRERLITDLEEEILFLLSLQETELSTLAIVERTSRNMQRLLSLARVHETLLQLEANGLINTTSSNAKKNYTITDAGITALQTDWSHYSRSLNEL